MTLHCGANRFPSSDLLFVGKWTDTGSRADVFYRYPTLRLFLCNTLDQENVRDMVLMETRACSDGSSLVWGSIDLGKLCMLGLIVSGIFGVGILGAGIRMVWIDSGTADIEMAPRGLDMIHESL